ncbi:hypothetical protein CBOM_08000 [Ceraceosorus bombacis]|uniref:Uncharacterized protein n=1 Tax=Ceraceosorus bombacis TaxID=401625 RepID=A0A0P1BJD2_9BASI|nr:hypothetical protein CBOM_08000 [Ceraceosorus bombacis]
MQSVVSHRDSHCLSRSDVCSEAQQRAFLTQAYAGWRKGRLATQGEGGPCIRIRSPVPLQRLVSLI